MEGETVEDDGERGGVGMLTETEEAMRDLVRDFVDRDVIPVVRRREHEGGYAADLLQRMRGIGLAGLPAPVEYGGIGASVSLSAAVFEELGRGWIALADMLSPHFAATKLLTTFGTADQRERFLPALAAGEDFGAIALTEPVAGSDLRNVELTAVLGEGGYRVNGTKTMITHASHAATVLTLCQVKDADGASQGLGVLVLRPFEDAGVTTTGDIEKLGHRGVDLGEVVCADAWVGSDRLLGGTAGTGLRQVMSAVNDGRIFVGAGALGMAQRAWELAAGYTKEREAFGGPLVDLPVVRGKLAEMWVQVAGARALLREACRLADGQAPRAELITAAAVAKVAASRAATEVSLAAMQLHGGYGYTTEFDIERIYRDAPMTTFVEGTNDLLLQTIATGTLA
jgi:alkylation response protein AidB-like acyl-CoA dehydrogenase